jgi:hypothetical protein
MTDVGIDATMILEKGALNHPQAGLPGTLTGLSSRKHRRAG